MEQEPIDPNSPLYLKQEALLKPSPKTRVLEGYKSLNKDAKLNVMFSIMGENEQMEEKPEVVEPTPLVFNQNHLPERKGFEPAREIIPEKTETVQEKIFDNPEILKEIEVKEGDSLVSILN